MATKAPVSSTTIISISTNSPNEKFPSSSSSSSSIESTSTNSLHISSKWNLAQLPRVYRAAKKMQRVTSAWSGEKETEIEVKGLLLRRNNDQASTLFTVETEEIEEGEKNRNLSSKTFVKKVKISSRIIFIPYYQHIECEVEDFSTLSSAAVVEFKIAPVEKNDEKWKFEILSAPNIVLAMEEEENTKENATTAVPHQQTSKNNTFQSLKELNVVDAEDFSCHSTAIIPTSVLCKTLVQEKELNIASFSVEAHNLQVSFTEVAPKESVTDNLVQGVFSIWESVKKTVNENATTAAVSSMIMPGNNNAATSSTFSNNNNNNNTSNETTTKNGSDLVTGKQQNSAKNGDNDQGNHHLESKKNKKAPNLPSSLSEALPSAERALHRWLQWICDDDDATNDQNNNNDIDNEDDYYFTKTLPRCKMIAAREVATFLHLLIVNNNSNKKSTKVAPVVQFIFQTMLLSPFAAAVTTVIKDNQNGFDLRDWLLHQHHHQNKQQDHDRDQGQLLAHLDFNQEDLDLVEKLANCPAPTFSGTSSINSSKTITTTKESIASVNNTITATTTSSFVDASHQSHQTSLTTTTTTTTKTMDEDTPHRRFADLLEQHNASFLIDFITTVANVLVVQVEYGAHYRPLLRAEGWGKLIHFVVTKSTTATATCESLFASRDIDSSGAKIYSWSSYLLENVKLSATSNNEAKIKTRIDQILASGYFKNNQKHNTMNSTSDSSTTRRKPLINNEEEAEEAEEDVFKIVTDDFTIAKEKAFREKYGFFSDSKSLLFPFKETFQQHTLKYLISKCSVDGKEMLMALREFSSGGVVVPPISTIEHLLDFLSEVANSLVVVEDDDNDSHVGLNVVDRDNKNSKKKISSLLVILQNLQEVLESCELVEYKLWGSRIVTSSMNVSSVSLKRKVNELILVAQEY